MLEAKQSGFLSTPSARRATYKAIGGPTWQHYFYPRPPRGGRPSCIRCTGPGADFYPRPPRGGRPDDMGVDTTGKEFLSTPSARRATFISIQRLYSFGRFLSTPSARRATRCVQLLNQRIEVISIHALREEGDAVVVLVGREVILFLSTPSARRATSCTGRAAHRPNHFYPRPPRGGRPARHRDDFTD